MKPAVYWFNAEDPGLVKVLWLELDHAKLNAAMIANSSWSWSGRDSAIMFVRRNHTPLLVHKDSLESCDQLADLIERWLSTGN
jgi:hypothetical protein